MRATIIIPQRGNEHLTDHLTAGILEHERELQIIIVDDSGYITDRNNLTPSINMLWPMAKRGLTNSWNAGIIAADTEHIILLNNDVKCHGKFVDDCKPSSRKEIVGIKKRREPLCEDRKLLQGWFLSFNRSLWEERGEFDTRFKLYYQDTDFQLRALKAGGSLRCVSLPLKHLAHKTAHNKKLCPERGKLLAADKAAFKEKYGL